MEGVQDRNQDQEPYVIQAVHYNNMNFYIEEAQKEHDFSWSDVESYYVKWGQLRITMKDKREVTLEGKGDEEGADYKWPCDVLVFDEEYKLMAEGNGSMPKRGADESAT